MAHPEIKITMTQNKKIKPDENKLSFGKYFTDHMFVMDYDEGTGWHSPEIMPNEPFAIDPAAMVFHYGQAVFEGMKAYRTIDGNIALFRPEANFKRLNDSNDRMCIPAIDEEFAIHALKELIKIDEEWIPTAPNTSLYIRPFIIATEAAVGVHPSRSYKFFIILSPVGPYYASGLAPTNILIENDYVRAVRGGIGYAKAAANYAISLKGQQKAIKKGYAQVLWLDGIERKYVEEVGTSNVFFVIGDDLVTPELNGSILPGITRNSVMTIAKSWGLNVVERKISVDEVFAAAKDGTLKEAFGSGTAAVVSPVANFIMGDESVQVGDGNIGQLAQKLYDTVTGIQFGKIEDSFGWIQLVK